MSKVKNNVLPHSKAKLDLYNDYLSLYLPILSQSLFIDKINLFDIFCGAGVYEDGNMGSPLIAASQILKTVLLLQEKGKKVKPIRLIINDFDKKKVDGVKEKIESLKLQSCDVEAYNLDADEMFQVVIQKQSTFTSKERNLVFIDPYGYSKISKGRLYKLLQNERTEVILFLPVAQMYRFANHAQQDLEAKAYEKLRTFTDEFLGAKQKKCDDIFSYINALTEAFSFEEKFYTSSHYIQRDKANYYAVFFIGHHIYGLEKFLDVKWKNDRLGKGFNQKPSDNTLFGSVLEDYDKTLTEESLRKEIKILLQEAGSNNLAMYEFVLKRQFQPGQANAVLKDLVKAKQIKVFDDKGAEIVGRTSFGISYDAYKTKKPTTFFELKK